MHDSSKELNFSIANRGTFSDAFSGTFFWLMPILGIEILQFADVIEATYIWDISNHTKLLKSRGFLECILATPSNHSMHHVSNVKYLDKNFGQVLIVWDIPSGTFRREDYETPIYGLKANIETSNSIKVEFKGFKWLRNQMKTATNWKDKLGVFNQSLWMESYLNYQRTEVMVLSYKNEKAFL